MNRKSCVNVLLLLAMALASGGCIIATSKEVVRDNPASANIPPDSAADTAGIPGDYLLTLTLDHNGDVRDYTCTSADGRYSLVVGQSDYNIEIFGRIARNESEQVTLDYRFKTSRHPVKGASFPQLGLKGTATLTEGKQITLGSRPELTVKLQADRIDN